MKSLIQGFLTGVREQARALAPRLVTSPRFSQHLNTLREISPLWEGIPGMGVQVPPRTRPFRTCLAHFGPCVHDSLLWLVGQLQVEACVDLGLVFGGRGAECPDEVPDGGHGRGYLLL